MTTLDPQDAAALEGRSLGTVRGVGVSILLAVVTLGVYTYFWVWWTHREIKAYSGEGIGGPLGFVLYFFISPVTWFLIPGEIQKMYEKEGERSPVGLAWGFWFLLPLIGAFIWFPRVQGALNAFWISRSGAERTF